MGILTNAGCLKGRGEDINDVKYDSRHWNNEKMLSDNEFKLQFNTGKQ